MARHFFLDGREIREGRAFITGDEARHISLVLRRRPGDRIHVVDQDGREYTAVISSISPERVGVSLIDRLSREQVPVPSIVLGQAIPRFRKMDFIVQKATELGVRLIIPFFSSRSTVRLSADQSLAKCLRWQKIAREATKQCGGKLVPPIEKVMVFKDVVRLEHKNSLKLILWEDEKTISLKAIMNERNHNKNAVVLVGPEGGFSPSEVELAAQCGFRPVSLGAHIMRSETASLYVLSVLHYEWKGCA